MCLNPQCVPKQVREETQRSVQCPYQGAGHHVAGQHPQDGQVHDFTEEYRLFAQTQGWGTVMAARSHVCHGAFLDRLLTCSIRPLSEFAAHSESTEIRQDWKPPFLSNEEFTQLMLEVRTRLNMSVICSCSFLFDYKQKYVFVLFFLSGIGWIFPCNNDWWEYNLCFWECLVPTRTLTCECNVNYYQSYRKYEFTASRISSEGKLAC